jgi:hypothetical protein
VRLQRAAFERAVAAYRLDDVPLDDDAVEGARESLEATGLFLLGEPHGAAENPRVLYSLARRLGTRALALEWSYDELDAFAQPLVASDALDVEALWSLPTEAEAFCGDGRFTAGHVALLIGLRAEGYLEQLVLVDRAGPAEIEKREQAMTDRLLAERRRELPTLVWLGGFHTLLELLEDVEPLGARVARELPGLRSVQILYDAGEVWFHEPARVGTPEVWPVPVVRLPVAHPADVPER